MRAGRKAVAIAAAMALVAPLSPAAAETPAAELLTLLEDFRAAYGFPGGTAAIALSDGQVVTAATGLADIEAGVPMTPESRMLAASIGKTFVAATVLAFENEGSLARDGLLAAHLGDRDWFGRLPNADSITVRDLLRHTSGLPDHVHMDTFRRDMAARVATGGGAPPPEQAIAFVLDAEPFFAPGEGWAYTDTGYLLLGLVIESATDRSYYAEVAERFLRPLGLADTAPSDERTLSGLAVGYTAPGNPFGMPPRTMDGDGRLVWDPAMEWTGGGLVSTSRDLASWGHALFAGKAMQSPYLGRLLDGAPVAPDAPGVFYGAGVAIHADTPRGPVFGHGGWIPGYVSSLRHFADHGVTVAFQINSDVTIVDDSVDLVPALEAALADLAIANSGGGGVLP